MPATSREAGTDSAHSRAVSLQPPMMQPCGPYQSKEPHHTLSRLRPLARRLFNTALPDLVDIRSKNP